MTRLAIIGSTGLSASDFIEGASTSLSVETGAGIVTVEVGQAGEYELVFLKRSYDRPGVPPHAVKYRANTLALMQLDVRYVLATSIVGSLTSSIAESSFIVVDQFLDFTKRRDHTLFDRHGFAFVDVTDPYCAHMRGLLLEAARDVGVPMRPNGCYVSVDGPRYETRAEIEMYRRLGGDVIGMTNVPEVVMAREAGICYATLAYVSNMGAGLNASPITRLENYAATIDGLPQMRSILTRSVSLFHPNDACACHAAAADFLSATVPD
jgi:5'-methylthioinosine phosphorylase